MLFSLALLDACQEVEFNPAPMASVAAVGITVSIKLGSEQIASVAVLNVEVIFRSHTLREDSSDWKTKQWHGDHTSTC